MARKSSVILTPAEKRTQLAEARKHLREAKASVRELTKQKRIQLKEQKAEIKALDKQIKELNKGFTSKNKEKDRALAIAEKNVTLAQAKVDNLVPQKAVASPTA